MGLTINMYEENDRRNMGKKGLDIYRKLMEKKLPVISFKSSMSDSDNITPIRKNAFVFYFSINNQEDADKIKKEIELEKISIVGSNVNKNNFCVAIDVKNKK